MRAIRARLGLSGNLDQFGPKPYRMRRKTYQRLRQLYSMLLVRAFGPVAGAFLADDLRDVPLITSAQKRPKTRNH